MFHVECASAWGSRLRGWQQEIGRDAIAEIPQSGEELLEKLRQAMGQDLFHSSEVQRGMNLPRTPLRFGGMFVAHRLQVRIDLLAAPQQGAWHIVAQDEERRHAH